MKCAPEHALSVLKSNSFVLKWKRVLSVLSPLSLFSRGGSHMGIDFHVYMPSTYIVKVIWECYQLQAKYEQNSGSSNC